MSKDVYDSASPIPAKLLNSNGSVTDFNNNEILPPSEKRKEIYSQSGYIVNKCLNPDGTIGTLPNGGGGGTSDYNNLSNKPTLYGKALQGNQLPEYYGCADLTKFNDLEADVEIINEHVRSITEDLIPGVQSAVNTVAVNLATNYYNKPEVDDKISNVVINSVVMPQAQIYLSAGGGTANGTFSLTEPATTQTFPTLVSTTPTLRNTFSYVFTQAGFVSSLSTWQFLLKLQNLSAQTDYVISASIVLIRAGQPDFILSQLTNFQFETGNQQTAMNIILPFLSNNISDATAKLNYALGDRLEVRLTWSKQNGSQQTINIVSIATNPCTFIRNGGEIGSTLVLDNNGVDTQSQAQRNRLYDRISTISPSDSVIKADVINKTGTNCSNMDLANTPFTCPSAGRVFILAIFNATDEYIGIKVNDLDVWVKYLVASPNTRYHSTSFYVNKGDIIKLGTSGAKSATISAQLFRPTI